MAVNANRWSQLEIRGKATGVRFSHKHLHIANIVQCNLYIFGKRTLDAHWIITVMDFSRHFYDKSDHSVIINTATSMMKRCNRAKCMMKKRFWTWLDANKSKRRNRNRFFPRTQTEYMKKKKKNALQRCQRITLRILNSDPWSIQIDINFDSNALDWRCFPTACYEWISKIQETFPPVWCHIL